MGFLAECQRAQVEMLAVIWIHCQSRLKFPETLSARAENNRKLILPGSDIKLIFVDERLLIKFLEFFLFEFQVHCIAESRRFRAIWLIRNSQNVDIRFKFSLLL